MWIMDFVWPITALWAGPLGLWAYFQLGRRKSNAPHKPEHLSGHHSPDWRATTVGALHCGAGCTLGDLLAESFMAYAVGAMLFGWSWKLFGHRIFAAWIVDYVAAFAFGILFQYFTIKPMKKLKPAEGLVAALKADTLSLSAWQIGMYGWMAVATFGIFGHELEKSDPVFWFMMQIAMLAGFITSLPVNWWLLRTSIKEPM